MFGGTGRLFGMASETSGASAATRLRVQRVRPAYQQVAAELRNQIISGVLQAGDRLPTEPELCEMFGVSRSTVREALRMLASQHLIETTRGVRGGSFAASPDPVRLIEDLSGALGLLVMTPRLSLADMREVRGLLEPAAARLAAERASPEVAQVVMDAATAPRDPRDPAGFTSRIDFHATVLMATGNPMMPLVLQAITDVLRTRLERARAHDHGLWAEVDACHVAIAEAIARRDGAAAESLMRDHLASLPAYGDDDNKEPSATGPVAAEETAASAP